MYYDVPQRKREATECLRNIFKQFTASYNNPSAILLKELTDTATFQGSSRAEAERCFSPA